MKWCFIVLALLVSCKLKSPAESKNKASNASITLAFPAVVRVKLHQPVTGKYLGDCSGSVISSRIVLTAGHCAISLGEKYDLTVDGLAPTTTIIYPDWETANATKDGNPPYLHDLTLLGFAPEFSKRKPEQGTKVSIATISDTRPKIGSETLSVGYGALENEHLGVPTNGLKTCGSNAVLGFVANNPSKNDMIIVRGESRVTGELPGVNAQVAHGDSGGPLFVDGEIIGAVSHGDIAGKHIDESFFTNLFDPLNRSFIDRFRLAGLFIQPDAVDSKVFVVKTLLQGGPAETSGLKQGDRILGFGATAKQIKPFDSKPFDDMLLTSTNLFLKIRRGDKDSVLSMTLDKSSLNQDMRTTSKRENASVNCPADSGRGTINKLGIAIQWVAGRSLPDHTYQIISVERGSPAERSRLFVGDLISQVNSQPLGNIEDVRNKIESRPLDKVTLTLVRRGPAVAPSDQESLYLPPDYKPRFGARVKACGAHGLCVEEVVADSVAIKSGLKVGDRLVSFNDIALKSSDDFANAVDSAPADQNITVVFAGEPRKSPEDIVVTIQLDRYIDPKLGFATNHPPQGGSPAKQVSPPPPATIESPLILTIQQTSSLQESSILR